MVQKILVFVTSESNSVILYADIGTSVEVLNGPNSQTLSKMKENYPQLREWKFNRYSFAKWVISLALIVCGFQSSGDVKHGMPRLLKLTFINFCPKLSLPSTNHAAVVFLFCPQMQSRPRHRKI